MIIGPPPKFHGTRDILLRYSHGNLAVPVLAQKASHRGVL